MSLHISLASQSLTKYGEELCGDKAEVVRIGSTTVAVLADGLGSGVKANILATLTSKIISTMLAQGASVEQAVETIVCTLPECHVRKLAYSTFSILCLSDSGDGYLVEFDNPFLIFIRQGKVLNLPCIYREYAGKGVYETHFTVLPGDVLTMISDGVIYAGVGATLNFGWSRDNVAEWLCGLIRPDSSAPRLAASLIQAVGDLYLNRPGDDATVLVACVRTETCVNLLSGPPANRQDDARMVRRFMKSSGCKVVCGGSSANMVARLLDRKVKTQLYDDDPQIPPAASIEGIDLVTEGVLTLSRTVELLREYRENKAGPDFFRRLDAGNGAARLAGILLEKCTCLRLFIGSAINPAHQNPNLPADLSIKRKLIDDLAGIMADLGKHVERCFY